MKMQKPEFEVVRFEVEDVIATSGIPANFYKFTGLGSNSYTPDGSSLSIKDYQGKDVTNIYSYTQGNKTQYRGTLYSAGGNSLSLQLAENQRTQQQLNALGIYDGLYERSNPNDPVSNAVFIYKGGN